MENQDQEMLILQQKHFCKLCDKSFPCGRSLGGHMRSHLMSNSSENAQRMKNSDYVLRENPKKACKFEDGDVNDALLHGKVCKECGKSFQSWKALFGHMKCHSEKIMNSGSMINNRGADSWIHNNNVTESNSFDVDDVDNDDSKNKKKRSRRATKRSAATVPTNSSTLTAANSGSISENFESVQEEEVAKSLIMLSKDSGNWSSELLLFNSVIECSDNNSEFLAKKSKSSVMVMKNKKKKIKDCGESEFVFSSLDDSDSKKIKFECSTCNKSFHSYQALGGHRASHKKSANKESDNNNENSPVLLAENKVVECVSKKAINRPHECPICFKIFSSGQALGGHKRSHLIAEAKTNQNQAPVDAETRMQKKPEIRDFLDLNLPAPIEEEENDNRADEEQSSEFQAWWMSNYKHEQLVEPTF